MIVQELIAELKHLNPKLEILLSSDAEGNYFKFLNANDVSIGSYTKYEKEIEVGIYKLTDELKNVGYTEEDVKETPVMIIG